jgi:hypothetical protein
VASRLRNWQTNELLLTFCYNTLKERMLAVQKTSWVLKIQTAATLENCAQIGARVVPAPSLPVVGSHADLTLTGII